MEADGIGLGDLILKAAKEIRYARDKAKETNDPVLKLEDCELELKVTLKAEAGGGIKVWLLDLSAKGSGEHASTIKLKFAPARPDEVFQVEAPLGPEAQSKREPARKAIRSD